MVCTSNFLKIMLSIQPFKFTARGMKTIFNTLINMTQIHTPNKKFVKLKTVQCYKEYFCITDKNVNLCDTYHINIINMTRKTQFWYCSDTKPLLIEPTHIFFYCVFKALF